MEDVAEAGAVAEAPQPASERGTVRAVLAARHVDDVGLPPARAAAAFQALPLAAGQRRRVLVPVDPGAGGDVVQQPLAASVGARAVEHQRPWPSAAEGASEVRADVRVPGLGEGDLLDALR